MIATHNVELAGYVGERPGLDVLHPRSIDAERHVVLTLASNGARMASNAVIAVEQESETRHRSIVPADTRS